MVAFEVLDAARFQRYVVPGAAIEVLHTGMNWGEGPVWFADTHTLIWADIPANRLLRWSPGQAAAVFREGTPHTNGNTRDRQGRLVSCEGTTRRVVRTEPDGSLTVLADRYQGKRFNSPNDVVVKSDDTVWFSDPDYGLLSEYVGDGGKSEIGACCVFRLDLCTGELRAAVSDMMRPNGLAFSPDEAVLYVADSGRSHTPDGPHHIKAFDVRPDGSLANARVLAEIEPGSPDGFRVDADGNVWTSAGDGVHCIAPDGKIIGKLRLPEQATNLTFGGADRSALFVTGITSLYRIDTGAKGALRP